MPVEDVTVYMIIVVFLNYTMLYRSSKLLGSLLFVVIGIGTYYFQPDQMWGIMIAAIGLISTIYAILFPKGKIKK